MGRSKILCTFSGKHGDILFSLPTVKAIAEREGSSVDFRCMPAYRRLLSLIRQQPYISCADIVEDWICLGSPHGDQPWMPPKHVETGYEKVYHLTYRRHPGSEGLMLAPASAQNAGGIDISHSYPFITVEKKPWANSEPFVSWGFGEEYREQKRAFVGDLKRRLPHLCFVSVEENMGMDWLEAAQVIQESICFVGSMSALHVLAHGLGKQVLIYEPDDERRTNPTYRSPYKGETIPDPGDLETFVKALIKWGGELK